jgi:hypothetical protein
MSDAATFPSENSGCERRHVTERSIPLPHPRRPPTRARHQARGLIGPGRSRVVAVASVCEHGWSYARATQPFQGTAARGGGAHRCGVLGGAGLRDRRSGDPAVLATGIAILGVSSLLAGLSVNYVQLLVLHGVGGLGSALFTVSSFALLMRVAAPGRRGRSAGTYQTGFLLGSIAGPAFGGPLAAWSLRAPFFVYAATLLVAGSVAVVFLARTTLHEHEVVAGTADRVPTSLRTALRSSAYRAAVANNFAIGWSIFGVRSSLIPLFVVEALRLDRRRHFPRGRRCRRLSRADCRRCTRGRGVIRSRVPVYDNRLRARVRDDRGDVGDSAAKADRLTGSKER